MTVETLKEAQEYLTFVNDNRVKLIVDIKPLLKRHPSKSVIWLLGNLYKENQIKLQNLVLKDKTTSEINDCIAIMFRIHMAIKTIEDESEEEVRAA